MGGHSRVGSEARGRLLVEAKVRLGQVGTYSPLIERPQILYDLWLHSNNEGREQSSKRS